MAGMVEEMARQARMAKRMRKGGESGVKAAAQRMKCKHGGVSAQSRNVAL